MTTVVERFFAGYLRNDDPPPKRRNAAALGRGNGASDSSLYAVSKYHNDIGYASRRRDLEELVGIPADDSPWRIDRPFELTRFPSQAADSKKTMRLSLRELAAMIEDTEAADKADLPWLKGARFGRERSARNSLRHNANVLGVTGVEGDYDGGEIAPARAKQRLRDAGITALIYTTPSHSPESPRWRVIAPCSAELSPVERTRLAARLNGIFGGALDPSSFTLSQAFYFGNVTGRPRVQTFLVEGRRYIDEADDLDVTAISKGGGSVDESVRNQPSAERTGLSIEDFSDAVMTIPNEGEAVGYDAWFEMLAGTHHETGGSDQGRRLAHRWSRQSAKYDERKTDATWESLGGYASGPLRTGDSVLLRARRHGWLDTRTVDVDPDEFDDIPPEDRQPRKRRSGLTFLSPAECAVAERRGYVVKGLMAPGDVGCIFGQPGAGKSLLAPHLGYAVAQGRAVFGMRSKAGKVFYVAAEDETGMKQRVTVLREHWGDAPDFALVAGCSDLLSKDSADLKALSAAVKEQRPALVFIDTLALAFPGLEENDAAGMGRVVAVARQIASFGAAVILVHHDTKEGGGTPRGHSVFNGALDMAIHVEKDEAGIVRGRLTKNRNGPCDRNIAFRIEAREIGKDEDDDPITAALAGELEASGRPAVKLSGAQRAALEVLSRMGGSAAGGEWQQECAAGRDVSASENHRSRLDVAKRAIRDLLRKGAVKFFDGVYRSADAPPLDWSDDDE